MKKNTKSTYPAPGFYDAHLGSPQNCAFMKGTDVVSNYLRPSLARSEELRAARHAFDRPEMKLRNLARFQGQTTECFKSKP